MAEDTTPLDVSRETSGISHDHCEMRELLVLIPHESIGHRYSSSAMDSDQPNNPVDEKTPAVRGLSPEDRASVTAANTEVVTSEAELTDDEWAALERATDPDVSGEEQGTSVVPGIGHDGESSSRDESDPSYGVPKEGADDEIAASSSKGQSKDVDPGVNSVPADGIAAQKMSTEVAGAPKEAPAETSDEVAADETVGAEQGPEVDDGRDVDAPETLSMPLPRVIAVANQKGGVGKTTTTVNVAACLAEQGYRTLLVDLDPQANASTGLGLEPRELQHSIYHVMLHNEDADSCIEPTEVKNLFVLPSSLDLAGAEIELVPAMSREHRLRVAIESVIDDYDYVLIDCPPSLGLLTINALTAANEVLVPIQCEYYALEGLGQLMRNVELVKANLNPELQISHIVLVMFDPRTKLAGQVVDEVRGHFGSTVCSNVIPRTVRLSEAPSFGQPITTFDTQSRGASAYRAVTQEVIDGQA